MKNPNIPKQNLEDCCTVCGRRDWERGGTYRLSFRQTIYVLRCRNCRTVQRVPRYRFFQVASRSDREAIL